MKSAEAGKRELANFEIDVKPAKKGAASGKKAAPKKAASSASRKTAAGAKAGTASAAKKTAASAAKTTAGTAKKTAGTAKTASGTAKKTAAAAKNGTKKAASSSNRSMNTQKKAQKIHVEENPVARREALSLYDVPEDATPRRAKPAPAPAQEVFEFDATDVRPKKRSNPAAKGKKKRKKKRRSPFSGLTVLLLVLIAVCVGIGVWRSQAYEDFLNMKAVVARQTFYPGTTVEGVDVSSMTLTDAIHHWENNIEPAYREIAAVLNDGTRITATQLGYTSDYVNTLSSAWNAGRTGSLVDRYKRVTMHMQSPKAYEVNRSLYDDAVVRSYAAQLAEQINCEPVNARLESFDTSTQTFSYAREQVGRTLDEASLIGDIEAAISNGGGKVQLEIAAIAPEVTLENVSSQYGMITSAVTNASSSSSNRLNNIRLSLELINGTCLEPGESFSFNEVVGKRTRDRGFKSAPAYSGGAVTEEIGGGICQVSTTLFNAAVKSNMEIKERHSHSLTVSYVDLGKDAAVDWGNKDLVFENTSDDRVYICCYLSDDKRVHIGVFGKLLENGMSITLEGKKTGTVDKETQYQVNFDLGSGQTRVVQKGSDGYSAAAYKIYWDKDGNEIDRELLCKSNYNATPEIIEYGP